MTHEQGLGGDAGARPSCTLISSLLMMSERELVLLAMRGPASSMD